MLIETPQQAMGLVRIIDIRYFKVCEGSLGDAVSLQKGGADFRISVTAKARLNVPDWRHRNILPVKRPVPVGQMALIIAVLFQLPLVDVNGVSMPREE